MILGKPKFYWGWAVQHVSGQKCSCCSISSKNVNKKKRWIFAKWIWSFNDDRHRTEITSAAFASVIPYKCFQALVSLWSQSLCESYWKILITWGKGMHEFIYDKSCPTSLIALSDERTGLVGNRTVEYLICLDKSKAFDTVVLYPS